MYREGKSRKIQEGMLFHLENDGIVISQDIRDDYCCSVRAEDNLHRLKASNKQKAEYGSYILSKQDDYQFIIDFPYMKEEFNEFDESLLPGTIISITFRKTKEICIATFLAKSSSSKYTYRVLAAEENKPIWISLCGHIRDNIKIRKIHSIWNIQLE